MSQWLSQQQVNEHGEFTDDFISAKTTLPSGARLRAYRGWQGGLEASLEFSVPTITTGHNLHPSTVDQTRACINTLHREAAEWVQWEGPPEGLTLSRLDLDRDFTGVEYPDHLLSGLARIAVSRSANANLFHDAERGGALTLVRKPETTKSWRASLYCKYAQMTQLANAERDPHRKVRLQRLADQSHDVLRFEAQLRTRVLRPAGITTVADLHEETLVDLRKKYFDRAAFGTHVGGPATWERLVRQVADSPDRHYLGSVWQMLYEESLGIKPRLSNDSRSKYRGFARGWVLSAADVRSAVAPGIGLDFDLGAVVVEEGDAA